MNAENVINALAFFFTLFLLALWFARPKANPLPSVDEHAKRMQALSTQSGNAVLR